MDRRPLVLTGERTLPGVPSENYWFRRHEVAYLEAGAIAARHGWATVVDAGCGEGYGADLLADAAGWVLAVDLDAPVVAHVRERYPRLGAVSANLVRLPLATESADAVVSLQVIEHQWDVRAYLAEVARVLRPGGIFLCGTPNRLMFTPHSPTPVNPFHTIEFTAAELASWLGERFEVEAVGGVWHGPRLLQLEAEIGTPIPQVLDGAGASDQWPHWLADLVAGVTVDDFVVTWPASLAELAGSLDLLTLARRR